MTNHQHPCGKSQHKSVEPHSKPASSRGVTSKTEDSAIEADPMKIKADPDATPAPSTAASQASAIPEPYRSLKHFPMSSLENLITSGSAGLESAAIIASGALKSLKGVLYGVMKDSQDTSRWIRTIDELLANMDSLRAIIPVVGNTGAGKSSAINAVLGEEKLVPTNCMRACTAVITEIAYNESDDPSQRYRAEIEFTSFEIWEKEVELLFKELIDSNGKLLDDHKDEETEAGVAYAKIKAVYPYETRTKQLIESCNPKSLLEHKDVTAVLGTTEYISSSSASDFSERLEEYLDSTERHEKRHGRRQMAAWPLIKVVRIYVKAWALETGSVIVDLPGVQDSNVARSSMAANYMMRCSALWIVAPITRAVDDKTARNLLGNSFKLQLKMDGSYHSVTFVCSKADELSVSEAAGSLGLGSQIRQIEEQRRLVDDQINFKNSAIKNLEASIAKIDTELTDLEKEHERWSDLQDEVLQGKTVYPPTTLKRKRARLRQQSPKGRSEGDGSSAEVDSAEPQVHPILKTCGLIIDPKQELSKQVVEKVQSAFTEHCHVLEQREKSLQSQVDQLNIEVDQLEVEVATLRARPKQLCIQRRNDFSRLQIQKQFAAGIRDLDHDTAVRENGASEDPDHASKDYSVVADSLPVFCISSRAAQIFQGHFQQDSPLEGFQTPADTEIPQLQRHLRDANELRRVEALRAFLRASDQFLKVIHQWATGGGETQMRSLSEKDQKCELIQLRSEIESLEKNCQAEVSRILLKMEHLLEASVFDKLSLGVERAKNEAFDVIEKWARPVTEGGLRCTSYRAVCRWEGAKKVKGGYVNFNDGMFNLVEAIMKQIASAWAAVFSKGLPDLTAKLSRSISARISDFSSRMKHRRMYQEADMAPRNLIDQQAHTHCNRITEQKNTFGAIIIVMQRDNNRLFTSSVQQGMQGAYSLCAAESGPGCYVRMKQAMADHVEVARITMFQAAADEVKDQLSKELARLDEKFREVLMQNIKDISADWESLIYPNGTTTTSHAAFDAVLDILQSAEGDFAAVTEAACAFDQVEGQAQDVTETVSDCHRSSVHADKGAVEGSPPLAPGQAEDQAQDASGPVPDCHQSFIHADEGAVEGYAEEFVAGILHRLEGDTVMDEEA